MFDGLIYTAADVIMKSYETLMHGYFHGVLPGENPHRYGDEGILFYFFSFTESREEGSE